MQPCVWLLQTPHHTVSVAAVLLAALSLASRVSAQANPLEQSRATFGEIANQPAAPQPSPEAPAAGSPCTQSEAPAPSAPAPPAPPTPPAPPPVATVAAAPAAPKTPEAKPEWARYGFYLRLISGMGYMTLRGDGASVSGLASNSIIAVGGSIAPGIVIAGSWVSTQVSAEFKGGPYNSATVMANGKESAANKKATAAFSQLGALLDWYPYPNSGAHLGMGANLGMTSLTNQADESSYYGTSVAATALIGFDWAIAPTWGLGLAIVATGSSRATLKQAKTGNDSGYRLMPLAVGLTTSLLYF